MPRLVMKFGGTSVANVDRIRNVAQHVAREVAAGYEVAGVIAIVDRSEGGRQNIEAAGLSLTSLFSRDDFPP